MFHVKDSRSFNFTVLVFHTVVFFVLIPSCGGQSQVVGPSQPIVATVGEDVVLPCYLDPVMNAFALTVEWARLDLSPRFVLVWRDGVELESKKHPSYVGRTSLFIDELQHGNVSLKLSKVKISDEGTYRCFVPALGRFSNVQLVVGAASSPVIQEATDVSGQLQCESGGWYPEPEVSWLDGEGCLLPAGPAETVRGPDGLFTISSRVTVEKKHGNNFTCRVQQKNIQQTREAHVLVPDHFFVVSSPPSPPDTSDSPHVIIASVTVCAALAFLAVVFFVVWKRRQKNFRNTRRSCEDGAEKERTDSSAGDNSGLLVVMEREGERAPLMAGREEENNVDSRGEEEIESQSERQDLFVKNQQPERRRHVDGADGEREEKSVNDEREALSLTEGQTHQQQDMRGRNDKDEGQRTMEPLKEDSGPPIKLMTGGQNIDQEVKKEEETQKDLDTNKKETKLENETGKDLEQRNTAMTEKKVENQKEQINVEMRAIEEKRDERETEPPSLNRDITERPNLHQETTTRTEEETQKDLDTNKKETKLEDEKGKNQEVKKEEETRQEPMKDVDKKETNVRATNPRKEREQRRGRRGGSALTGKKKQQENQREEMKDEAKGQKMETRKEREKDLLVKQKQQRSAAEDEDENEKDHKEKQKVENQKEEISENMKREERMKNERKLQADEKREDKIKLKTQKGDVNQKDLDTRTEQRETEPPSVCGDVTERPNLKIHQETTRSKKQEEKQEETREQQVGSFKVVKMERHEDEGDHRRNEEIRQEIQQPNIQEIIREKTEDKFFTQRGAERGQQEEMEISETQKRFEDIRQEGLQITVQQLYMQEDIRPQTEKPSMFLEDKRGGCHQPQQEELMQINETQKRFEEIKPEIQQSIVNLPNIEEIIREKPEESFRFLSQRGAESEDLEMETDETENSAIRQEKQQLMEQLYMKEEIREQRRAESQEQQEEMETDETEMKTEEIRHQQTIRQSYLQTDIRQQTDQQQNVQTDIRQQTDQQQNVQTDIRQQTEGLFRSLPQRGAVFVFGSEDVDVKPENDETQTKYKTGDKRKHDQTEEPTVDQKRRRVEKVRVQKEKTKSRRGTKK